MPDHTPIDKYANQPTLTPDTDQGDWNSVLQNLRAKLATAEEGKAWQEASDVCIHMLNTMLGVSDPAEVLALSEHALYLAEMTGDIRARALASNAHGVVLLNLGDYAAAAKLLQQAKALLTNSQYMQETAMVRLNLVSCLRLRNEPINALDELRGCLDSVGHLHNSIYLRHYFSENAFLLSQLLAIAPERLPELAEKVRSSFFAATNLFAPHHYRDRIVNHALFRSALQYAHLTTDALLGLTTCLAFQHGQPQDLVTNLTQPTEALNDCLQGLLSEHTGLLSFYVDSNCVFAVLWARASEGVFMAPDFSASTLDTLVVNRWYGPCQEFRTTPTRRRRDAVSSAIHDMSTVLAQLTDSARDVRGRSLREAIADLPVETLLLLPHRHLAALPLDVMPIQRKSEITLPLCSKYQTATHTGLVGRPGKVGFEIARFLVLRDPDLELPSTIIEIEAIRGGDWYTEVRLSTETSVAEFRALLLSCDALHIACHSSLADVKDLEPSIRLADRRLTTKDLVDLDLSHMVLAVSASCDSALAYIDAIAARRGYMDTFGAAGCRNVIGSMWPVDDLATSLFFKAFYDSLASKPVSIVAAFNNARAWLRECPLSAVLRILHLAGLLTTTETQLEWEGIRSQMANLGHTLSAPDQSRQLFDDPVYWSPFILTVS